MTVTADSRRIISGSHDRLIRVWDLASGRLERTFESSGYVQSVAVTRDGLRIISCGDEKVHTWDLTNGQESISWVSDPGVRVLTCSTVPSEVSLIVYGDSAGGVHVLRLIEATM